MKERGMDMALTKEDLLAISDLVSGLLVPINERLDKVEDKLNIMAFRQNHMSRKLEDLQLDLKVVKRDIERKIHDLNDQMETVIVILEANELLPKKKKDKQEGLFGGYT